MVNLKLVKSSNASLCTKPLVAVFVGGTSNIGAEAVKCLARTHGTTGNNLRAYIIGRNAVAAAAVIAECQISCPNGQFIFLKAINLALMKDVDTVCSELMNRERKEAEARGEIARIDILVMSQANFQPWHPRQETSEGLDTFMSLLFYSRARIITNLLPLLSSPSAAHIISVFGPGRDATFIPSDLSLRSAENYGFMTSGSHAAYLKTFYFEYLAAKYVGKISLVHYFPGLVLGSDAFEDTSFPWWFRVLFRIGKPLAKFSPSTLSGEECGERTLFCASGRFPPRVVNGEGEGGRSGVPVAMSSDGLRGGGTYRVNWNGEDVPAGKQYAQMRADGWAEKMVAHTHKAWKDIEETGHFSG